MYRNTHWIDEVKDQETEEVIQEGTPQSAGNFNNMEGGISDAHSGSASRSDQAAHHSQCAEKEATETVHRPD